MVYLAKGATTNTEIRLLSLLSKNDVLSSELKEDLEMKCVFLLLVLSLIAQPLWGADWDFTDTLDDWEATGWQEWNYTGGGNPDAEIIQNTGGTVTIVDPSSTANFYMMRKTEWAAPYTAQLRVKVDSIADKGAGQNPVISSYVIGLISVQPVLLLNGIADWSLGNIFEIDTTEFQIFTIVAQDDSSAHIYANDDFDAPALVIPAGVTSFFPETRLEIGAPTGAVATITVDYVALGEGEILEIFEGGLAVKPNAKLTVLWGDLKR